MSESPASQPASSSGIAYTISTQYVKDFSFENPRAPMVFAQMAGKSPQVQVSVAVSGQQLSDSVYECILDIKAVAKNDEDVLFVAELSYAGVVLATGSIPMEHLKPLIMIEVPRQLFPFARAILSTATRDGGFMPLLLAPVDFEALHRQQNEAIDAEVRKMREGASS
ncbi:MAG TPA: protein-export chaperone SecB [Alphaproteobacteria bacterium]